MMRSLTIIALLSMSLNSTVQARVYKHTDEQGNVTFSDIPGQDQNEIAQDITADITPKTNSAKPDAPGNPTTDNANNLPAQPALGPTTAGNPNDASNAVNNATIQNSQIRQDHLTPVPVPVPDMSVPVLPAIPSTKSAPPVDAGAQNRDKLINSQAISSNSASSRPMPGPIDYEVSFTSPKEGQVFTQADANISVELQAVPQSQYGDVFEIILDGQPLPELTNAGHMVLPWLARGEHSLSLSLIKGPNSQSTLKSPPTVHFVQLRPSALIKPS